MSRIAAFRVAFRAQNPGKLRRCSKGILTSTKLSGRQKVTGKVNTEVCETWPFLLNQRLYTVLVIYGGCFELYSADSSFLHAPTWGPKLADKR